MYAPTRIHHDCAGGFWVVDYSYHRLLHFGWNQTIADLVLGQPDLTTTYPLLIYQPFSLAMNEDCSIMCVTDGYGRILRFRSPFNSASLPEGVLGQPNFVLYPSVTGIISSSTFGTSISDLYYDYKTQRLYILDYFNNRVVAGVTNDGTANLTIVYKNVTIEIGETLQINANLKNETLYIAGNLGLKNGSQTVIKQGQGIVVAQNISFGGVLDLIINSMMQNGGIVNVFNYSSWGNSTVSFQNNKKKRSGSLEETKETITATTTTTTTLCKQLSLE